VSEVQNLFLEKSKRGEKTMRFSIPRIKQDIERIKMETERIKKKNNKELEQEQYNQNIFKILTGEEDKKEVLK